MGHKTRAEQFNKVKVRKGNNKKVRKTKRHNEKNKYNRKQERQDIENYLAQTNGGW